MTPQEKYLIAGALGAVATKFYFHKSWMTALIVGLSVISATAIITAKSNP